MQLSGKAVPLWQFIQNLHICVSTLVHMIYDFIIKTGKNASCYWSRVMNVSLATSKALTRMTLPEICLFPKLKSTDGLGIVGCFYGTVLSFVIGQAIPEIPPPPMLCTFHLQKKSPLALISMEINWMEDFCISYSHGIRTEKISPHPFSPWNFLECCYWVSKHNYIVLY